MLVQLINDIELEVTMNITTVSTPCKISNNKRPTPTN